MDADEVLVVRDLHTEIDSPHGLVRAVDGVSFSLRKGRTLAVVGESGCGKTMTALSIVGLLRHSNARTTFRGSPIRGAEPARTRPPGT